MQLKEKEHSGFVRIHAILRPQDFVHAKLSKLNIETTVMRGCVNLPANVPIDSKMFFYTWHGSLPYSSSYAGLSVDPSPNSFL